MDAMTRKQKLTELKQNQNNVAMSGIPFRYRGVSMPQKVYKIPLDFLIYNKYNGRIGSVVLSYERQNGQLNPEAEDDKRLIEKFLYDSKKDRNEITMKSLQMNGQQRYGIVTADGRIVDGNRRAMLLNKLYHNHESLGYTYAEVESCQYFLAIILPDDAEERDMQQLETIYQMGEDDKLDYDPIEKYLKCKELKKWFSEREIAEFMSKKESQIREYLDILKLMEDYLQEYQYDGIYTRLEKTEGPFVDLNGYLDSYRNPGANVRNMDWTPTPADISALKSVCFDYIRARYEGKEFREIAKTGKDGSLFFYESLWTDFFKRHQEQTPMDDDSVDDLRQAYPDEDLSILLKRRDNEWIEKSKNLLKGNLQRCTHKLEDKRASNKPSELIERALNSLQMVDTSQTSFYENAHIEEMIQEINSIIWELKKQLKKK